MKEETSLCIRIITYRGALEFLDVNQDNKDTKKFIHKRVYYRCQETHLDEDPVSIFKTDID